VSGFTADDHHFMARALELARHGIANRAARAA
jgi:hypothetical protein